MVGILLAVKLIPGALIDEFRREAAQRQERPRSLAGAVLIIGVWLAAAALLIWLLWPKIS
jgi:hypothetical protein